MDVEHGYEEPEPKRIANFCKYCKPDEVGRPGRLYRGELKYRGNSSIPPRKDHKGKGKTLRSHRKGKIV